eukprot:CAMPEP_0185738918 /NCGR_PEP_ID=MMETSP1171-20130828/34161_1 /TAXON_ID=374046 /ORGANISM="Helicotheca tamensis, Strain CCMP826" /LENGTH=360 /DNA_ID=CAMNT_0028410311 /DNA_START=216 /DNA_END=1298 /DNA_ORIENTATION=-
MTTYKYWNREESEHGKYAEMTKDDVKKEAKILSLCDPSNDDTNVALHQGQLPPGATLVAIGKTAEDFDDSLKEQKPNVIFVSPSCPLARVQLPALLQKFPTVEWVHAQSAGIDFLVSDELSQSTVTMTNAKGQFSSSLAEYAMLACSYFAKGLPKLERQKRAKVWSKFDIDELRGKTMGIVGYGDIGRAVAKLAKVYGMKIVALRRNPRRNTDEEKLCDVVLGNDKKSLNKLMSESDYIVCSAPSTIETRGMVNAAAFAAVKDNAVFLNLGRGLVVDEEAMIKALKSGKLKGAALDVFIEEPLPEDNELWDLENVLISPHNMDQTATFMHEATEFFVNENLPRFICAEELLNPVDKVAGY